MAEQQQSKVMEFVFKGNSIFLGAVSEALRYACESGRLSNSRLLKAYKVKFFFLGNVDKIISIHISHIKGNSNDFMKACFSAVGGIAGSIALGAAGGSAGTLVGPWGTSAGAIVGSYYGDQKGSELGGAVWDNLDERDQRAIMNFIGLEKVRIRDTRESDFISHGDNSGIGDSIQFKFDGYVKEQGNWVPVYKGSETTVWDTTISSEVSLDLQQYFDQTYPLPGIVTAPRLMDSQEDSAQRNNLKEKTFHTVDFEDIVTILKVINSGDYKSALGNAELLKSLGIKDFERISIILKGLTSGDYKSALGDTEFLKALGIKDEGKINNIIGINDITQGKLSSAAAQNFLDNKLKFGEKGARAVGAVGAAFDAYQQGDPLGGALAGWQAAGWWGVGIGLVAGLFGQKKKDKWYRYKFDKAEQAQEHPFFLTDRGEHELYNMPESYYFRTGQGGGNNYVRRGELDDYIRTSITSAYASQLQRGLVF